MNEIVIYQTPDNQTVIDVQFDGDTIWLNQNQIAELFQVKRISVLKYLQKIYATKELLEDETCLKFELFKNEGNKKVKREILHYNLEVILSIGYRINAKRGTQFRQWATQHLKDYLVKGCSLNQKRLDELQIINQNERETDLPLDDVKVMVEIMNNYAQSFILLNQYDTNRLQNQNLDENINYEIDYQEAFVAIQSLKHHLIIANEATELFGNRKDDSFKSILDKIVQSLRGQYLYPSIEEQAANLLYSLIKNRPFSDGNKRIGVFIFVWFLEKNRYRFKKNGEQKINNNTLVAIALLIDQSHPAEKASILQLIINLIKNS